MYNVRAAGRVASLNGNPGSKNSQVKYSFGKEQRQVNAEAIKHGQSVPSVGMYSPSLKGVHARVQTYSLGQKLKDIFVPKC